MNLLNPIRDASPGDFSGTFLNAERNLLAIEDGLLIQGRIFGIPQSERKMIETQHTVRSVLGFPDEVKRNFSFLETIGFRCASSNETLVHYEASTMNINVYHGRKSYEIGAELLSVTEPNERYPFAMILRIVDPELAETYRNWGTDTHEGVAEGVRRLASDFRRCVDAGVLQSPQLFSSLRQQRGDLSERMATNLRLRQVRAETETAWRKKDFAKVVAILSPLEEELSPAELRKLKYSRQHI